MNDNGFQGTQRPSDNAGTFNAQKFLITQLLNAMNIGTLVKITAVTNSGGLEPVGFVDVQPLVNQLTGDFTAVPHAVVHHLVYFRLQGGTDAVILDPKVGDIGIAVFADRDTSSVKANKAQANPGSGRRNDMADGMYFGGVLNGTPEQYIQFNTEGIKVYSPTKLRFQSGGDIEVVAAGQITTTAGTSISTTAGTTLANIATTSISDTAPLITEIAPIIALVGTLAQTAGAGVGESTMEGPLRVNQEIISNTDVIAGTVSLTGHVHGGVASGGDSTDPPTP